MIFETRDYIQVALLVVSAVVLLTRLESASKQQTEQHKALGVRFDDLSRTVAAVSGDSRDHGARIVSVEGRVDRVESQVDMIVRRV